MRRFVFRAPQAATAAGVFGSAIGASTSMRFASKDYYKSLGVPRNATTEEIKTAYKKKVRELHPDVNPSPKAAEEFAQVKEAAETLQDPSKRSMYDMTGGGGGGGGMGGMPGGMPGWDPSKFGGANPFRNMGGMGGGMPGMGGQGMSFSDFDEMLKNFTGAAKEKPKKPMGPEPGADIHYKLKLSFLEAVNGVSKEISYNTYRKCAACSGSGYQETSGGGSCPHCAGRGKKVTATGYFHMEQDCTHCGGTGELGKSSCAQCSGRGAVKDRSVQTLPVPKGVGTKERLKVSGKGEAGTRNGPPGNLYVEITVDDHPVFHRDGTDIHIIAPISLSTAVLGGAVRVPTLTGEVETKVPPGTQQGDKLVFRGRGVHRPTQNKTGDFYVHFAMMLPKQLTKEQQDAIAAFAKDEKPIQLNDSQLQELKNRYRSWFSA